MEQQHQAAPHGAHRTIESAIERLLAECLPASKIAKRIGVDVATVRLIRCRVLRKWGVSSQYELALSFHSKRPKGFIDRAHIPPRGRVLAPTDR